MSTVAVLAGLRFRQFKEGAYGTTFIDDNKTRVIKAFRPNAVYPISVCKETFSSEVEAYEVATEHEELRKLVPRFFGVRKNLRFLDRGGLDISAKFIEDHAFELSFVEENFEKIGSFAISVEERLRIMHIFRSKGINHLNDASVLLNDDKIASVIDFAMKDVASVYDETCS